ncbi:unnamed protein product [Calypogeia fissa]
MVLQNLGRKVRFGVGRSYNIGWHQNVFRILPVIFGVAALATTVLLGSYLWALVTRRKSKKQGETHAPSSEFNPRAHYHIRPHTILPYRDFPLHGTGRKSKKEVERPPRLADFLSLADYKPNTTLSFQDNHPYTDHKASTIISFREFSRTPASYSTKVADYDNDDFSDEFDTPDDYAEVRAEEKYHGADGNQLKPIYNSPERYQSVQSWLVGSPDIRRHSVISLEEAEEKFARNQAVISRAYQQHKASSRSWKRLLFWKKSRKNSRFEFDPTGCGGDGDMIHSNCTTPIHHLFKSGWTRATVAPSTASITSVRNSKNSMPKRPPSGPIYYDGTPMTPSRMNRNLSSPLSGCSTPSREGLYETTYLPLKRPYSNYRSCPSPLYVP